MVLAITVMNLCSVSKQMGASVLAGGLTNGSTSLIVVSPDKMDLFSLNEKYKC